MTGFRASGPDQPRLDFAAFAGGWSRTRLIPVAPLDARLAAVAAAVCATHVNGGAVVRQFLIEADAEVADYFANNWIHSDFFAHFFNHPDVLSAIPRLTPAHRMRLGFGRRTGEQLLELLTGAIRDGGAYRRFNGAEREARALADGVAEVVGPRFFSAGGWFSREPWNDWFFDVAWDYSFFWFDRGTSIATVLLITDTD